MNMELRKFNILNKAQTIALIKLANFDRLCNHQNGFLENLFFGSPEKLLKLISYTIRIR
jgi:inorganic triphosphatase YgiF